MLFVKVGATAVNTAHGPPRTASRIAGAADAAISPHQLFDALRSDLMLG
jgi:hypothetical protein